MAGSEYVAEFSSDRSHMRTADGDWTKPPPEWPCIHGASASTANSLSKLRQFSDTADAAAAAVGNVVGVHELPTCFRN